MNNIFFKNSILICIFILNGFSLSAQDLGATFCWHYNEIYGGHSYPFNQSVVKELLPTTAVSPQSKWEGMDQWWENMVEEVDYSGIDYVALLSRGTQPNQTKDLGTGDPKHIKTLVKYMQQRDAKFKLAIFDDCPNSWTSSRNYNLYGKDETKYELFDCGNPDNYKYIWDYNLKIAFENIPDAMRYKIDNRPVIIFWSVKSTWMTNIDGNLSKIITYIKQQSQAAFGFEPYLIVMEPWFERDQSLTTTMVDAAHSWFSGGGSSYTVNNRNNFKTGVCVPSFVKPAEPENGVLLPYMNIKDQGDRLRYGLDNTVKAGAKLTLVEGFTDSAEGAALWRSSDEGTFQYYDYPNQRLNILRSYSKIPYPISLKMEVEACDFHYDLTLGNSGNSFLDRGDLDVLKCSDTYGGWFVTNTQATEWMEWRELPLVPENKFQIRYKSSAAATVFISVDGVAQPTISLPPTNSAWTSIDAGTFVNGKNSTHTVRLTIASGSPDINYFTRTNLNTGPVNVNTITVTPTEPNFNVNKSLKLIAQITPAYATNTKVTWASNNTAVATVDLVGLVTGVSPGTATITATTEDGAKTASSNITIENPNVVISLQAENAVFSGPKVATNNAGYNGTGFLDFTNNTGDYVKWSVTVPTSGNYELSFRYALPSGNRPLDLKVNGILVAASLPFLSTTSWTIWRNVVSNQILNAGVNEIMLTSNGANGGNIDELVVTNTSNLETNEFDVQKEKTVIIYPNPYKQGVLTLKLVGFETTTNDIKVKIINIIGQTIYQTATNNTSQVELNLSNKLNESIYFVSIESGNTQIIKKLIVK